MEIQHEQKENAGEFYIENQDSKRVGKLQYTMFGSGRLVIQHTEVGGELQGSGAAAQLVDAVADYVRGTNIKIVPVCPFAKKYMNLKHEKYSDVLA